MRACVLERMGEPLRLVERPSLAPGPGQLRLEVTACGVCRTDLHVVDGELPAVPLPIVPGHEIVGRVIGLGEGVSGWRVGQRAGVPWLGWACGQCAACLRGDENLCPDAKFTGYQLDGGYASEVLVDAHFALGIPERYGDREAAPLLCAGLIGWRALAAAGLDGGSNRPDSARGAGGTGRAGRLGLYGFGAAAHIVAQVARHRGQELYAFVRPGDSAAARFALSLGARWAGDSEESPPVALDAAILFAPVGALVPQALRAVRPGGTVVCAGIYMSEIPAFPYEILWGERVLRSVANLTRRDARAFLEFAATHAISTTTVAYPLAAANEALDALRAGRVTGAAVLEP